MCRGLSQQAQHGALRCNTEVRPEHTYQQRNPLLSLHVHLRQCACYGEMVKVPKHTGIHTQTYRDLSIGTVLSAVFGDAGAGAAAGPVAAGSAAPLEVLSQSFYMQVCVDCVYPCVFLCVLRVGVYSCVCV